MLINPSPATNSKLLHLVFTLNAAVRTAKYTEYPDAQHDSWTETYANPAFYDWLFAQTRS